MGVLEVIKDIVSILAAFGIIAVCANYFLQRRATHMYHERARLEKAITLLGEFSRSLNSQWSAVRRLLPIISKEPGCIGKLERGESFAIPSELGDLLYAAIPGVVTRRETQKPKSDKLVLTRRQSFALRWQAIARLNAMETVAMAWFNDVAHAPTIEAEMRSLLFPSANESILDLFEAEIATRNDYPALFALAKKLENK